HRCRRRRHRRHRQRRAPLRRRHRRKSQAVKLAASYDWFGGVLVQHASFLGTGYGRTVALVAVAFVGSLAIGTFVALFRLALPPQPFPAVIPPLGNLFIAMIKNSAIASSIAVAELLYVSEVLDGRTFRTFEIFTGVLIGYLSLTLPAGAVVRRLERRLEIRR